MGIKNFSQNLKKKFPEVYKICKLSKFAGHKIGIDVSIFFYAYKNSAIKQVLYTTDLAREELNYQNVTSYWLQKFHELMMIFIETNIMPVPVFDGPPFPLKMDTKRERREKLESTKNSINILKKQISEGDYDEGTIESLEAHLKVALWTTSEEIDLLKRMFDDMGIFYIQAKIEAECYLAELCKQGYISAVFTRDSDAFAYRTPIVITDIEKKTRLGKPMHRCTYVISENIIKLFEMTERQFVEFCILCGTDYNNNLCTLHEKIKFNERSKLYKPPSYGFAKLFSLIKDHYIIEEIIEVLGKKGFVVGFEEGKEILKEHGPRPLEIYRNLRDNNLLIHKDITNPKILKEIRGYFFTPPNLELEREIVHYFTGDMKSCFDDIFAGPNKERMLQEADQITIKVKKFEIDFLEMQTHILVHNTDC